MQCATIKSGVECSFMAKSGCNFLGGTCRAIVEKCDGCDRIITFGNNKYCAAFPDPNSRWRMGNCNMATHIKTEAASAAASKVRVGQQKQKKK